MINFLLGIIIASLVHALMFAKLVKNERTAMSILGELYLIEIHNSKY